MRVWLSCSIGVLLASLAGCATPASAPEEAATRTASVERGLPAQELPPGVCGLFLWDKSDGAFVFFAEEGAPSASAWEDGAAIDIVRVSADGDVYGQTFTEQVFAGDQLAVRLTLVPGEPMEDGFRFPQGALTLDHNDGWRRVVSVGGVRACQPFS